MGPVRLLSQGRFEEPVRSCINSLPKKPNFDVKTYGRLFSQRNVLLACRRPCSKVALLYDARVKSLLYSNQLHVTHRVLESL